MSSTTCPSCGAPITTTFSEMRWASGVGKYPHYHYAPSALTETEKAVVASARAYIRTYRIPQVQRDNFVALMQAVQYADLAVANAPTEPSDE